MKSINKKIIIGIVILLAFVALYFGLQQTFFEFGWIPFTEQSTSLTNYAYSNGQVTSKFWNSYAKCGPQLSGGDGVATFNQKQDRSCWTDTSFKFNENLKDKYFAVDYSNTCSRILTTSGPCDYGFIINGISISGNGEGKIEIKPSSINRNVSYLYIKGQYKTTLDNTKPIFLEGSLATGSSTFYTSSIIFSNPRYKPLFDCYIDNDEVLIFDEFASGSTIDINSLTYPVQKFCANQPPTIRSFTTRGITIDINGELLYLISEGGSYTVNQNETVRIYYITKNQAGILRCDANSAWNTITKSCESILSEGEPEPSGVNVSVVTIGDNQIGYSMKSTTLPLIIGDLQVTSIQPKYICECNADVHYSSPQPNANCWQGSINGQNIFTGDTLKLNDYIAIKYDAYMYVSHSSDTPCENEDWTNVLTTTIDRNGLLISKLPDASYVDAKSLSFSIDNKIANFDASHAGIKLKTTYLLLDKIEETYQDVAIPTGVSTHTVELPNELLGRTVIEVIPYVKINDKTIFGSNVLTAVYNVTQTEYQTQIITNTVVETVTVEKITTVEVVKLVKDYGFTALIVTAVVLLIIVGYLLYRRFK